MGTNITKHGSFLQRERWIGPLKEGLFMLAARGSIVAGKGGGGVVLLGVSYFCGVSSVAGGVGKGLVLLAAGVYYCWGGSIVAGGSNVAGASIVAALLGIIVILTAFYCLSCYHYQILKK